MATLGPRTRFLAAVAVSAYGDWFTTVAVVVSLYRLTGGITAPATAVLLRVVPRPLGALAGGHLADRIGALPALRTVSLAQAGMTALLALGVTIGSVPATLLALVGCQGLGAAAQPASLAAIPELVPAGSVGRVNAAVSLIFATGAVVAPAVAAGLLLASGPVVLITADAVTFLLAAALIARTGAPAPWPRPIRRRDVSGGIRLLFRHRLLRQLGAAQAGNFAVITALQAVLVAACQQRFGTAAAVGWIYTAVGVGAAAGGLGMMTRTPPPLRRRTLAAATLLELLPLGAFTLIPSPLPDLFLVALSGLGASIYQVAGAAEVARVVDPARLGQVNGAVALAGYVGMILGAAAAAGLAATLGWSALVQAVWLLGAVSLVAGMVGRDRSQYGAGVPGGLSQSRMNVADACHA